MVFAKITWNLNSTRIRASPIVPGGRLRVAHRFDGGTPPKSITKSCRDDRNKLFQAEWIQPSLRDSTPLAGYGFRSDESLGLIQPGFRSCIIMSRLMMWCSQPRQGLKILARGKQSAAPGHHSKRIPTLKGSKIEYRLRPFQGRGSETVLGPGAALRLPLAIVFRPFRPTLRHRLSGSCFIPK